MAFCKTFVALVVLFLFLITGSLQHAFAQSSWLDGELANWNAPGTGVPAVTREAIIGFDYCSDSVRPPETPEDFAVANQGWLLYGPYQLNEGISIVRGFMSTDVNCRPSGSQAFVFVGGDFAGTLSPEPMASRGDSTLFDAYIGPGGVGALYDRYLPDDGLCCPSSQNRVWFSVEWTDVGPVIVPTSAELLPAPAPGR